MRVYCKNGGRETTGRRDSGVWREKGRESKKDERRKAKNRNEQREGRENAGKRERSKQ